MSILQWFGIWNAWASKSALYTDFAAARIVGWSAHRLEELKNVDKIIRPAYKPLCPHRDYIRIHDR